jgi:hypothetical protein
VKRITCLFALALTLLISGSASAQEWAKKMFKIHEHDFGTVAVGAKSEYLFELENIYEEDVHIVGVRTSCGCTTPTITKDTLKTWEKGAILAKFNTKSFLGQRSATITVTIDKPFFAEVQLNIKGFIRSDIVFSPGQVDFGSVDQGTLTEKKVSISYAGRSDWQIVDVRSANPHLEVDLTEASRAGGRVVYNMTVHLKPDAPEGFLQDQLVLVTDDQKLTTVPVIVEGQVLSSLTVSPASLFLGVLEPGETVTKQLVVKGKQPFKIKSIKCTNDCFAFKPSDEAKKIHIVPLTFTANDAAGKLQSNIEIITDLGGKSVVTCAASATINEGKNTVKASASSQARVNER